ncbi:MAG: DsbC family protein [Candidatus Sedimenticola endophacoides]
MKKIVSLVSALLFPLAALADSQADMQRLLDILQEKAPDIKASDITPTPLEGLYQVVNNGNLLYVTPDMQYIFKGSIINLKNRVNVTAIELGRLWLQAVNAKDEGEMVIFPAKGEGEARTITVFTDTTCPYCNQLHQEVDKLNEAGITVRYILFPRGGMESESFKVMTSVWCAEDRKQALTDAKAGKEIAEKSCDTPLVSNMLLARKVGLQGTPLIYIDNGVRIDGYRPAEFLIEAVREAPPAEL